MQILLPPECFRQPIKLPVVEKKEDARTCAKTSNSTTPSAVRKSEPYGTDKLEDSTLPEKVSKAN